MNTLFTLNHWIDRSAAAFVRALSGTAGPAKYILHRGERQAFRPVAAPSSAGKAYQRSIVAQVTRPVPRQLRVVQVLERGMPRGSSGRLFISGGIDDVCAELDRLVRREEAMLARLQPTAQAR